MKGTPNERVCKLRVPQKGKRNQKNEWEGLQNKKNKEESSPKSIVCLQFMFNPGWEMPARPHADIMGLPAERAAFHQQCVWKQDAGFDRHRHNWGGIHDICTLVVPESRQLFITEENRYFNRCDWHFELL